MVKNETVTIKVNNWEVEVKQELYSVEAIINIGLDRLNQILDRVDNERLLCASISCINEDNGNKFSNFIIYPKSIHQMADSLDDETDSWYCRENAEAYTIDLSIREAFTMEEGKIADRILNLAGAYENSIYFTREAELYEGYEPDELSRIIEIDEDECTITMNSCVHGIQVFNEDMQLVSEPIVSTGLYKYEYLDGYYGWSKIEPIIRVYRVI